MKVSSPDVFSNVRGSVYDREVQKRCRNADFFETRHLAIEDEDNLGSDLISPWER